MAAVIGHFTGTSIADFAKPGKTFDQAMAGEDHPLSTKNPHGSLIWP
jgi:hypothetical protein